MRERWLYNNNNMNMKEGVKNIFLAKKMRLQYNDAVQKLDIRRNRVSKLIEIVNSFGNDMMHSCK